MMESPESRFFLMAYYVKTPSGERIRYKHEGYAPRQSPEFEYNAAKIELNRVANLCADHVHMEHKKGNKYDGCYGIEYAKCGHNGIGELKRDELASAMLDSILSDPTCLSGELITITQDDGITLRYVKRSEKESEFIRQGLCNGTPKTRPVPLQRGYFVAVGTGSGADV